MAQYKGPRTVHKVAFFSSGEGIGDFRDEPLQNIHFGEAENLLSRFQVGLDRVELNISASHLQYAGFGTCLTFGATLNGSATHCTSFWY